MSCRSPGAAGHQEAKDTGAAGTPRRAAVGVLSIHGIGVQPRGRTLAEFAGPLVTWLHGWYDGLHAGWVHAGARFHAFGLDDVALLEGTSLGGGILEAVPESDLVAADGALAAVHVTATKPVVAK